MCIFNVALKKGNAWGLFSDLYIEHDSPDDSEDACIVVCCFIVVSLTLVFEDRGLVRIWEGSTGRQLGGGYCDGCGNMWVTLNSMRSGWNVWQRSLLPTRLEVVAQVVRTKIS